MTGDPAARRVAGSRREAPHAVERGAAPPGEQAIVTLVVRRRTGAGPLATAAEQATLLPGERSYADRAQFAAAHGADRSAVETVERFAAAHDLTVTDISLERRTVTLGGTVAALSQAFGVHLATYEADGVEFRGRVGDVRLPAEVDDVVEGVFGLDTRPQARPYVRTRTALAVMSHDPVDVARLYDFPAEVRGRGQCIGIVELGGGYRTSDLQAYFAALGLPVPSVSAVSVDGARNHPTTSDTADSEVMMDIEIAAAVAPEARIVVYFAPNTDQGFLHAILTAVHDAHHRPSVVSISWGHRESTWTPQSLTAFNEAFKEAAAMGVTVCCASADYGSSDNAPDGKPHVDFPASSPFVLSCGGTRLETRDGRLARETVWNDGEGWGASGGGVSDFFDRPPWQEGAGVPTSVRRPGFAGRGVPDVAGNADPESGYRILVDGQWATDVNSGPVGGGTSAAAPLWAGLVALLNEYLGAPVGHLNPLLYERFGGRRGVRDVTVGHNGHWQAGPGWDPCTGLGTPAGRDLAEALAGR